MTMIFNPDQCIRIKAYDLSETAMQMINYVTLASFITSCKILHCIQAYE